MKPKDLPRAVGYLRMSTDDQLTSIPIQKQRITQQFGDKYNIVRWYTDEGKSASHSLFKREEFLDLIEDVETKSDFSVVLAYSTSRFSRLDAIETSEVCKVFRDNNIKLVTALDGEIDFQTSTGRIMNAVFAESNHSTVVNLSKVVIDGKLKA